MFNFDYRKIKTYLILKTGKVMIINNSILPMDIFEKEIFVDFQNPDLNKMRMVSKEFLKSIDDKSRFFYKSEDFEIKNSWKTFNEAEELCKKRKISEIAEMLANKRLKLINDYKTSKEMLKTFDLIKDLFGGRKAFENLPNLIIADDVKNIQPKEMSAPVMRGKFKTGREFFVIRVEEISEKITTEEDIKNREMYPSLWKSNFNAKMTFCQLFFFGATVRELVELKSFDRSLKSYPTSCGDILPKILSKESSFNCKYIIKDGTPIERLYNFLKKFIRENGDKRFKIC